jgi:UDP-N-acetylmuramoyl-L-alanyl-D-glutamate--2,6-diaminopimelate ligase
MALGIGLEKIKAGAEDVKLVRGRLEKVSEEEDFTVLVDYAHTDGALECVLSGLRPLVSGRLMVVFGCGGDRDSQKRPRMAAAVEKYADCAWMTSDNPRSEDPMKIIEDMKAGITDPAKFSIEVDRAAAIGQALDAAGSGDLILIAGKGHETFMQLKDKVVPFDDREVVRDFLRKKKRNNERVVS